MDEDKLLHWALDHVVKEPKITSFKDQSIKNCKFLFNLLYTIEPRAINWDLVTDGETKEDQINNCKYVLAVARKVGATIFLTWEDLYEVNQKMIMTLFAALNQVNHQCKAERQAMPNIAEKDETS